jgi:hypothetical protein
VRGAVEMVREERTVRVDLGAVSLRAYSGLCDDGQARWFGSAHLLAPHGLVMLAHVSSSSSSDEVFGQLIGQIAEVLHAIGVALDEAERLAQPEQPVLDEALK